MSFKSPLRVLKSAKKRSSVRVIAERIGVTPRAVYYWLEKGRVPRKRIKQVYGLTGRLPKRVGYSTQEIVTFANGMVNDEGIDQLLDVINSKIDRLPKGRSARILVYYRLFLKGGIKVDKIYSTSVIRAKACRNRVKIVFDTYNPARASPVKAVVVYKIEFYSVT